MTLVSCIMPTADRRHFVPQAIRLFLAQDHDEKELIILDDGADAIADLVPADGRIRHLREMPRAPIGTKRNIACAAARGEVIVHWDDDDWYAPWRLSYQVRSLLEADADICGLDRVLYRNEADGVAWEYVWPGGGGGGTWLHGATLCYRSALWQRRGFPSISIGEDTQFLRSHAGARMLALPRAGFYVGRIHAANTSRKMTADPRWQRRSVEEVAALTGLILDGRPLDGRPAATEAVPLHSQVATAQPDRGAMAMADATPAIRPVGLRVNLGEAARSHPAAPTLQAAIPADRPNRSAAGGQVALAAAAAGIGDIIRVTPLIRVLHRLGYQVDVLLAAHAPETADLLRGAPEVRRVILAPGLPAATGAPPPTASMPELEGECYEIAAFTYWAAPLVRTVAAERVLGFSRDRWLAEGDSACVEQLARKVGWTDPMPPPFAVASDRRFDLPPGTVALHPGCKPDWPWKRWHGFDALAALLPSVVIVGSETDRDNRGTYFGRDFVWPAHVRDFTGQLPLTDTAALIGQCAGLVSNDSGLMHVGVALGVKTLGVFGITSPAREAIPSASMVPISKGLACEPACRRGAWGRRTCPQSLACLTSLTAEEVKLRLDAVLPQAEAALRVTYTAAVFDATGYGEAARLYVHALHRAGIKVAVTDSGATPPQVEDRLVRSLLGSDDDADFHIFHGIPPYWARAAFPRRRVIAMTVWETDTMPQHWRGPLTHAVDVWLPCRFNVDVFARGLGRTPFLLPHPLADAAPSADRLTLDGVGDNDFVFFSIFEWQDRKSPDSTMDAFLRAFMVPGEAVLVLKCGPGAAQAARVALASARQRTGSQGRVVIAAAAWDPAQVSALHARGDCYVSLHKGEGWGYPLFDAAARGNPVIATNYSGPLDYLNPGAHWLVRYQLTTVRQRYAYYHPAMRWAEPDLHHASEGMRWVFANRALARERAAAAAVRLRETYTLERIGAAAKARLLSLRDPTPPVAEVPTVAMRAPHVMRPVPPPLAAPPVPIPGPWYDADYFEHGRTSNWDRGYHWSLFQTVFRDAGTWLADSFPEARSALDIGCAKGFLVRALRERGIAAFGFDHSPWAIDHAEPAARPYLRLASVDDAAWDQQFDLATAMFVLESLTEGQLRDFLPRARGWIRQGLVATIAPPVVANRDRDPTRVTQRDRAWWRTLFLECGWKQDAMHRLFEASCARHPVPRRLGWDVHIFAPGP